VRLKSEIILLYILKGLSSSLAVLKSNIPKNLKSQYADIPPKVYNPIIFSLDCPLIFSAVKEPRQAGMDR
jgi:hypothetical protein